MFLLLFHFLSFFFSAQQIFYFINKYILQVENIRNLILIA